MAMWTTLRLRKGERFENHAQFEPFVALQHLLGQSPYKCVAVATNEPPARAEAFMLDGIQVTPRRHSTPGT